MTYASAAYEVTRDRWNGVAIEVYHSPRHRENIARMIDAARKSLAYHSASLSSYQHRSRVVEFPRYVRDGMSLPGMIALSESTGFDARVDGAESIDFPVYITAHEVAHQRGGQQLVAANVQGAAVLHETLAQYSALMITAREVGEERIRRVLDFEREEYVYYHRGALAMWELREAFGEPQISRSIVHSRRSWGTPLAGAPISRRSRCSPRSAPSLPTTRVPASRGSSRRTASGAVAYRAPVSVCAPFRSLP